MNAKKRWIPVVLTVIALAVAATTLPAVSGAPVDLEEKVFTYYTTSKAKVSGIGSARGTAAGAIGFLGGAWGASERDEDGDKYWFSGTYSRLSKKTFSLRYDAAARSELELSYENWFRAETGESVSVHISSISAVVKVKSSGAAAKAKISVRGTVTGSFGTRSLRVKTKAKARLAN